MPYTADQGWCLGGKPVQNLGRLLGRAYVRARPGGGEGGVLSIVFGGYVLLTTPHPYLFPTRIW